MSASDHPSGHPPEHASGHPSEHASGHPSEHPSGHPSEHPSAQRSGDPSGDPPDHRVATPFSPDRVVSSTAGEHRASGATVHVRDATVADLPAIAAIYTHYVLRTTITFNTEVRTPREWQDRYEGQVVVGHHHLLVAEVAGAVTGFVESQPFRPKPAYDRSVELSVYVAPDATGAGVGGALYSRLLERLEVDAAYHRAYAVIALPNEGSEAFHRRHGFVLRGTLTDAGHKFGRYLDVAYYEREV